MLYGFGIFFCGKRGIRTPGTVTRTLDFESSPIDHSGSFPKCSANVELFRH